MKKLLYVFLILVTIISVVVTIASYVAGTISPAEHEWLPFLSLAILPLTIINLFLFLLWCVCRSRWCVLPLSMILMHFEFISSMFQVRVFQKEIPTGKEKIKVISYNVDNFQLEGKDQLPHVVNWVKDENPDIVCLQESSTKWMISADSLAQIFSDFPYHISSEKAGADMNMTILSKFPITEKESLRYPLSCNQSYYVALDVNGKRVRMFSNHLQTTSVNSVKPKLYKAIAEENKKEEAFAFKEMTKRMQENFKMRASQADFIRRLIDKENSPVIVCGDFNDPPLTYTYRKVKGDLIDGFRECGSGFGYTFRQIRRVFRIDYILYSSDFQGVRYESPDVDFSDHKPVVWEGYLK